MELIDIKEKEEKYKDFNLMDSFRIVIYSILGIIIFFLPIKVKGTINTIIYHLYFFIQSKYIKLFKVYVFLMIIIGSLLPILKNKNHKYCVFNNILKCIRLISILFILIIFSKVEFKLYNNSSLVFIESYLLKSIIILLISSFFLPLITDYGLLEIFESYFQKYTKKIFKLSGKCVLNILVYLFVDVFSGMFMTNILYKKGKIRQNEACIIISCFSFTSILNCYYLSDELRLKSLTYTFILVITVSLFINFLICRLWPLKNKKKSYICKSSYKECNFKKNKFKNAIIRYLSTKNNKKLMVSMYANLKESFNMIMIILPNLVIILFIGEFLIYNTEILNYVGKFIYPFIDFLKLPSKVKINEVLFLGIFNGDMYIDLISIDKKYITNFMIFMLLIVQTVSISTNIIYIDTTSIPINKRELLYIGIEKILISMMTICLLNYLSLLNL